ncbi:response regulator receiver:tetratricopeptide TPR_4 [Vibrio sinaloensis DSM 21326]|uniref:Response regulator receiver:tetratricopeptide TPR_4 n=1 Tax=Vibrio sinaloensis DSM 21326 TaxID=945550 RepID=E8M8G8_PHOS4|nr:response regulator [Vibrio sinaloensis]EGA69695.1 response regulator receiver:tetratricopeptide TPR_4 [Vibrio sinaloensis DSM 21326]
MSNDRNLSKKRILIVEENSMLSASIKNMLKKMGGVEDKLHKAQNVMTFKQLVNQYRFDLIICSYMSKNKVVGPKYHYLYQQSRAHSHSCCFVVIANGDDEQQIIGAENLEPDEILEQPFNYNQFKQFIVNSLYKRSVLKTVHCHLDHGRFDEAIEVCNIQLSQQGSEWLELPKVVVDCYVRQEQYQAAIALLQKLTRQVKHRWPLVRLISLHYELGNGEEALVYAHEYESMGYPQDPMISQITAHQSLLGADLESAIVNMTTLSIRNPHIAHLKLKCAWLSLAQGHVKKALTFVARIDAVSAIDEQEWIHAQEMRLLLEVALAKKAQSKITASTFKSVLNLSLCIHESELVDSHELSKSFYNLLLQVSQDNPVCSPKRLEGLYRQTQLPHRKFILLAVALHIGCLDLAEFWLTDLKQKNSSHNDIVAAIHTLVLQRAQCVFDEKQSAMRSASEKASLGSVVDSLAIKAKEAPYFISHHSHFINAMLKFNVVDNSNIELLKEQFAVSVAIVIANLVKQDPMHPKVSKIRQAKRIVQERLQKRATA